MQMLLTEDEYTLLKKQAETTEDFNWLVDMLNHVANIKNDYTQSALLEGIVNILNMYRQDGQRGHLSTIETTVIHTAIPYDKQNEITGVE